MSKSSIEGVSLSAVAMDTVIQSTGINIRDCDYGAIQAIWSGASAADAVLTLQYSLDGTNWASDSTTIALNAASGSKWLLMAGLPAAFFRVSYAKGTNATGSLTVRHLVKAY